MAARTSRKKNDAQLAFEALSIEGGLLSPEWLSKVAQLGASHQSEADYGIRKGLSLRDELGRYWRIAQAEWAEFDSGRRGGGNRLELAVKFAQALLRECFGFASLASATPVTIADRLYPLRFHAVGGRVPIVVAPAGSGLDTPSADFGDGTRKRSAFGLTQEYLNAEEKAVWGVATDGLSLRIVRDNASLTRPAWIEVDLGRLFAEARYADFTALWLLMHESRFGREGQAPTECALEQWRTAGREQGTRARDLLRDGVQDALVALGQGFLSQRDNQALRDALKNGSLTERAYFQQLLRLVYRLIFLITAEERDLLFAPDAPDSTKQLYAEGYGLRRLRERSAKRRAHDRYTDLYTGLKIVFRGLEAGQPVLGLPALAGLFSAGQTPAFDGASLENHSLLEAVFRLSWIREGASLSRVNWRDMGPEELGSVYESLLELVPVLTNEGRVFAFASADKSKGNARKTTGSYYTPDSLVQVLLDSALEPVVQRTIAANPGSPVEALLKLSIVDPACGSGHFLLAAARRLAAHVARLEANGTPSPKEYRHALRRVVGQCVFGVDLNPMAIELCRLALWMEAVDPGKPLSFLDSHLQQGNALLGATPELMKSGIPDEAWGAIEGDDRKTAAALKKRNKKESLQDSLALVVPQSELAILTAAANAVDVASDSDAASLAKKQTEWTSLLESVAFQHQKLVADAWCAAFVWPKEPLPNAVAEAAPTNETWRQLRDEPARAPALTVQTVKQLARDYEFLHWHLLFPQVFAKGGFDVVLGNPPWERMKLQTDEWMAHAGIDTSKAPNAATRNALLTRLKASDQTLLERWTRDARRAEANDHFARCSNQFPRTAAGDMNSYALFAELGITLLRDVGFGAWVLPLGIVSDKTYAGLCSSLMKNHRLRAVYGFVNERQLFADVLHNFKFVAFSVGPAIPGQSASFIFGLLDPADVRSAVNIRGYELTADDVAALNPDTQTCPVFIDGRMARVLVELHRRLPALSRSGWCSKPQAMLHMGAASKHFVTAPTSAASVPVYESKMVNRYNHRFASFGSLEVGERSHMLPRSTIEQLLSPEYEAESGYFCPRDAVPELGGPSVDWLLVFRRIANPALVRTSAFCVLPRVGVGDSLSVVVPQTKVTSKQWARDAAIQCWLGNSVVFDAVLKQKMGGNNFSEYVWNQLPIPTRESLQLANAWLGGATIEQFVIPRVCELIVTSRSVVAFSHDLGLGDRPFRWNEARRRSIEAELDAFAAISFGLSRPDFEILFDAFPVLKERELETEGEFVTRNGALAAYDALFAASKARKPYHTLLSPPPADPSVAHPDTRKVKR